MKKYSNLILIFIILSVSETALSEIFYAADYGANCNGTSNTWWPIHRALIAASDSQDSHNEVVLPEGVCLHSGSFHVYSNTTLRGQGINKTSLKRYALASNTNVASIYVGIQKRRVNKNEKVHDVVIRDLKIIGRYGYDYGYVQGDHAIEISKSNDIKVVSVHATKFGGEAIYFVGTGSNVDFLYNKVTNSGHNAYNFNGRVLGGRIIGNFAADIGANCIEAAGNDLLIANNDFRRFKLSGIIVGNLFNSDPEGATWAERIVIRNNQIRFGIGTSVSNIGISLAHGAKDIQILNNVIQGIRGYGFYASSKNQVTRYNPDGTVKSKIYSKTVQNVELLGNRFYYNGVRGVSISGTKVTHVQIKNNVFLGGGGTQKEAITTYNANGSINIWPTQNNFSGTEKRFLFICKPPGTSSVIFNSQCPKNLKPSFIY